MIRRALLALALALAVVTVGGTPAQAHTKACAGGGPMVMGVLPLTGSVSVGFSIHWFGGCVTPGGVYDMTLAGTLTGSCAGATGTGQFDGHHHVSIVMEHSVLVLTGDAVGTVVLTGKTGGVADCGGDSRFFSNGVMAVP